MWSIRIKTEKDKKKIITRMERFNLYKDEIIIDKNARVLSEIFNCYKKRQNPKKFLYGA